MSPENAFDEMDVMELECRYLGECGFWSNVLRDEKDVSPARPVNAPDSRDVMELKWTCWLKMVWNGGPGTAGVVLFQVFQ